MPQVRATTPEADCRAAARRVGSNPQQQARWLLDFCYIDVPRLAPDERLRLRQQWAYVLGLGVVSTPPRGSDLPTQHPLSRELDQWHQDIRRKLGRLLQGEAWEVQAEYKGKLQLQNGVLIRPASIEYHHEA